LCDHPNIIDDPWLTAILRKDAYKLVIDASLLRDEEGCRRLSELQRRSVFMYAKVPVDDLVAVRFAQRAGFHLVDTNVVFERKQPAADAPVAARCEVRWAVAEDGPQAVELSGRSFRCSRFHLDPEIPRDLADRIKAEWARSFFAGKRGQRMAVARIGGSLVGFLLLLEAPDGTLTIDLIATDADHRRTGVAQSLIAFVQSPSDRPRRLRVGTQLANIPSVRLYEKMGYQIAEAMYVFHYHNGQAAER